MTSNVKILLASTSPRRQELIKSLGLPVEVIENHADESFDKGTSPDEVVRYLARKKARVASETRTLREGEILVAGDTIVVLEGNILGKPQDEDDAFQMLQSLQGQCHAVYSGVACIDGGSGQEISRCSKTIVKMKPLSDDQIRRYIESGEPMDKAGSYAIQGLGATIVESIEGDYFTVVGLPISLLADMLRELGVHII